MLLGFVEQDRGMLREAIAAELFRRGGESLEQDYLEAESVVGAVEAGCFAEYQRGLGPLLVDWFGDDLVAGLAQTQLASEDAALLAEALGRTGRGMRPRGAEKTIAGVEALLLDDLALVEGEAGAGAFARGVGWRLHRVLHRTVYQPWRAGAFLERVPGALADEVLAGYEEARRRGRLDSAS